MIDIYDNVSQTPLALMIPNLQLQELARMTVLRLKPQKFEALLVECPVNSKGIPARCIA